MIEEIPEQNPIVTGEQMRASDRRAIDEVGIPGSVLMENAARGTLDVLARHLGGLRGRRLVVLCGKGNNGGDGLALARLAIVAGADVRAVLAFPPDSLSGDAAIEHRVLLSIAPDCISAWDEFQSAPPSRIDAVVDALLGTGSHGDPAVPLDGMIEWANACETFRLAIDIPTGLDAESGRAAAVVFHADATATMAALKPGLLLGEGRGIAGIVEVVHIGLPGAFHRGSGLALLDEILCRHLLAPVSASRHKYDRGKVLVVGGSRGMIGAPVMSAESALASGAGLVVLALPDGASDSLHPLRPEIMTRWLSATDDGAFADSAIDALREELPTYAAMAIGPGLSRRESARDLARAIVAESTAPLVIDADGLNAFTGATNLLTASGAGIVITPHHGEMARLLGIRRDEVTALPLDIARRTARDLKITVVLKGSPTVIAFPDGRAWINGAGNPGMATAGSGDVLTGAIAASIAQSGSIGRGTLAGVFLHSLAGDIAARAKSMRGLCATDITAAFGEAYRQLEAKQ